MLSNLEMPIAKTLYDVMVLCRLDVSEECQDAFEDLAERATEEQWSEIGYCDDMERGRQVIRAAQQGRWAGRPSTLRSLGEAQAQVEVAQGACPRVPRLVACDPWPRIQ